MKTAAAILLAACLALPLAAQEKPHGIPNLSSVSVNFDGRVEPGEYPTHFVNSQTGIGVSWVSDGKLLYVALESPAKGWVAIGFGAEKVRGTSMFIGYNDGKAGRVDEHMGSWVSTHRPVDKPRLVDFATSLGAKGVIVEFSIPLELSNGQVIASGQPMPFVLSYHAKKISFKGRPTKKASATLVLGKPEKAETVGQPEPQGQ